MKKVMLFAASAAVLAFTACGGGADKEAERKKREADSLAKIEQARQDSINASMQVQTVDVFATVKGNPDLSTLVALLEQAKLETTLQDASVNYTLFAPTNAAFDKLDAKVLSDLKDPKNAEKLKDLLTYHVVRGKQLAADIAAMGELQALNDKVIAVKKSESGAVGVGNAVVTVADVDATNGVVHTIDAVLTVPAQKAKAKTKTPTKTTPTTEKATEPVKDNTVTGRGKSSEEKVTGRSGSGDKEEKVTGRGGSK